MSEDLEQDFLIDQPSEIELQLLEEELEAEATQQFNDLAFPSSEELYDGTPVEMHNKFSIRGTRIA